MRVSVPGYVMVNIQFNDRGMTSLLIKVRGNIFQKIDDRQMLRTYAFALAAGDAVLCLAALFG